MPYGCLDKKGSSENRNAIRETYNERNILEASKAKN